MSKEPKPKAAPARQPVGFGELEQQIVDLTEALQRERADSLNLRRRHDEQLSSLRQVIKADVARAFLPVVDNFERSLKHLPKELEGNDYIAGIQGIVRQFEKILESIGVEKIPTVGETFDPRFHDAVSMEEGDGAREVVCEELQPGYKLGDQVIRHAMVKVRMED